MTPLRMGGAVLGTLWLAGCTGLGALGLRAPDQEPIDWAQQNRKEIAEAEPEPEPEILPVTHFSAGQLFESKGNIALAVLQYRKALAVKKDFVSAYNRLGICLDMLGRYDEADRCFSEALRYEPQGAYLYNNLGFSLMLQKRWPEAAEQLRVAVDKQPDFTRAQVNLGMTLAQQGLEDQALQQFERAVGTARGYFNLGLVYRQQGNREQAIHAFERALELQPSLQHAKENLQELVAEVSRSEPHQQPVLAAAPVAAPTSAARAAGNTEDGRGALRGAPQAVPTSGVVEARRVDFREAAPASWAERGTDATTSTAPYDGVLLLGAAHCLEDLARLEYLQMVPPCSGDQVMEHFGWAPQPGTEDGAPDAAHAAPRPPLSVSLQP